MTAPKSTDRCPHGVLGPSDCRTTCSPKPAERCPKCDICAQIGAPCPLHEPAPESPAPNAFDDNRNPITLSVSNGKPQAPAQGEVREWKFVREYTNSPNPRPALQNELRELLSVYDALKAERDELHQIISDMSAESTKTARMANEYLTELAEAKRDKDTLIDIQIRVGKERDAALAEVERYRHIVDEEQAHSNRLKAALDEMSFHTCAACACN